LNAGDTVPAPIAATGLCARRVRETRRPVDRVLEAADCLSLRERSRAVLHALKGDLSRQEMTKDLWLCCSRVIIHCSSWSSPGFGGNSPLCLRESSRGRC
jgi:hypothetical protein